MLAHSGPKNDNKFGLVSKDKRPICFQLLRLHSWCLLRGWQQPKSVSTSPISFDAYGLNFIEECSSNWISKIRSDKLYARYSCHNTPVLNQQQTKYFIQRSIYALHEITLPASKRPAMINEAFDSIYGEACPRVLQSVILSAMCRVVCVW